MIYLMVLFPVILSDPYPRFQGHGVIFKPIDALNVLCVELTHDLFIHSFIHSYSFNVEVDITQLQTDREARKEDRIISICSS